MKMETIDRIVEALENGKWFMTSGIEYADAENFVIGKGKMQTALDELEWINEDEENYDIAFNLFDQWQTMFDRLATQGTLAYLD